MKGLLRILCAAALLGCLVAPAGAVLQNLGAHDEYFHDTDTGLYWLDPILFHQHARVTMNEFATHAPHWNWAVTAQVSALFGRSSEGGVPLEDVIGERFSIIANGGPRWVGFHSLETQPDGWLIESDNDPDFDTVTASSYQSNAAAFDAGAWLTSTIDPTNRARLWDAGSSWELFFEGGTGFYWQDPTNFAGQTRAEVQGWLDTHPDWRWASQDEVYALMGVHGHEDRDLSEIMGEQQETPTGGKRWVGFYDHEEQPDGLLLGSLDSIDNGMLLFASTQYLAETHNAGAWILTETNPTAVQPADWGAVKSIY